MAGSYRVRGYDVPSALVIEIHIGAESAREAKQIARAAGLIGVLVDPAPVEGHSDEHDGTRDGAEPVARVIAIAAP